MTPRSKPVWAWLPGAAAPVRCGSFTWRPGLGQFTYDAAWREAPGAFALDPVSMPWSRSARPMTETRQNGLFGVLRDASPEGFGLAVLEKRAGRVLDDPLEALEAAVGDGVGAIEVCDDIEAKLAFEAPALDDLLHALRRLPDERPASAAAREVQGVAGTSLGGERPKLTVRHDGQLWIAKLQDRGDAPHMPLREFVAMTIAAELGIEVPPVAWFEAGGRQVFAVRRFDREMRAEGVLRAAYASAHTALRLDAAATRESPARSYHALARELARWCARAGRPAVPMQAELWRRMAFNAIIGNGDDHPRNHGLLWRDGGWTLAPAFDIAPYPGLGARTLAMAVTRRGSTVASRENLLEAAPAFGVTQDDAQAWLDRALSSVDVRWGQIVETCGLPSDVTRWERPDPATFPIPAR